MSWSLRPGLAVVRRDDGHLQVGIDPPLRVVLPDEAGVRRVLDALARGEQPQPGPTTSRVLAALCSAGAVVDPAADPVPGRPTPAAEAAWAHHGSDAPRRLAARRTARVSVDAPGPAADQAAALLRGADLQPTTGTDPADVRLLLAHGVLPRDRADACMRTGTPHLVLSGQAGGYVVGPFVVPGESPCLRCDDASRAEDDPRRPVVVEQVARVQGPPGDATALVLALAWAVRDVVAWVEGDRPTTWGASWAVDPTGLPRGRSVPPHPHCGCGWAAFLSQPAS